MHTLSVLLVHLVSRAGYHGFGYHSYGGGGLGHTFVRGIAHGAGAAIGWKLVSFIGLPLAILIAVVIFLVYRMKKKRANRDRIDAG